MGGARHIRYIRRRGQRGRGVGRRGAGGVGPRPPWRGAVPCGGGNLRETVKRRVRRRGGKEAR